MQFFSPFFPTKFEFFAGLDGIRKQIDPTAEGYGPINENIFNWSEEKRSTIKSLPTSVESAMQAVKTDNQFLKVGQIFDDTLIETWTREKLKEAGMVHLRPNPYEIETYYNC